MKASLQLITRFELVCILLQALATAYLQEGYQYITLLPFVVVMQLIQQLNKLGFIFGQVQALFQTHYSATIPFQFQNTIFGLCCQVAATRDYVPRNLQGYGWVYFAGYICYLTLGILSLGMFMSQNNLPYHTADLHYLGGIQVASVLMAGGLNSSWVQWITVSIIGIFYSVQFWPMLLVCLYGFYNWNRNL